jgi:hypothetical protein
MWRARQRGASALMILVIMVLILAAIFAAYTFSRVASGGDERNDTIQRLAAAAAALDRFAAANGFLPCPANPTGATGVADVASAKKCNHGDDGTLPWGTLGLNSDAGLDGWGRKITYRVYTGGATGNGSLTQPLGVNMTECDLTDPTAGDVDPTNGLCVHSDDVYQRSTTRVSFLAGKGLSVTDFAVAHNDAAYVLVSHGQSGQGAWTIAGTRIDLPIGADERANTRETGPFTIRAFSDPDTSVTSGSHFDDLLAYVAIPDLVKRIGMEAREWPETVTSSLVLTQANVEAAAGAAVNPSTGDTGRGTLSFATATVSGFTATSTPTNISYDANASGSGTGGIGIVSGGSAQMSSGQSEWLRVDLTSAASTFAVSLDSFGVFSAAGIDYTEKVELRFYNGTVQVGSTLTLSGCHADGGLASFSDISPGASFTSIDIVPVTATGSPGGSADSSLLVAEIKGCAVGAVNCRTSLWSGANTCN